MRTRQIAGVLGVALLVLIAMGLVAASSQIGDVHETTWTVDTLGAAGSATGSQDSAQGIGGHIYAVHLDYASGISSTTDITLSLSSPPLTVMTKTNSMTDTWYYPSVAHTDSGASARAAYKEHPFFGQLGAELAGSTAATPCITITLWWGP